MAKHGSNSSRIANKRLMLSLCHAPAISHLQGIADLPGLPFQPNKKPLLTLRELIPEQGLKCFKFVTKGRKNVNFIS
jgi:hypothetical protein